MKISGLKASLAGISAALIILTPIISGLYNLQTYVYIVEAVIFFSISALSPSYWRLDAIRVIWVFLLAILIFFLLLPSFQSISQNENEAAIFLLSTILVGLLSLLAWDRAFYHAFWYVFLIGCAFTAVQILYGYVLGSGDFRHGIDFEGYLTAGKVIAIGLTITVPQLLSAHGIQRAAWLCVFFILMLGLVAVLARGALLFSGVISILMFLIFWPKKRADSNQPATGIYFRIFLLLCAISSLLFLPDRTRIRVNRLFSGGEFTDSPRTELWAQAIARINEAPVMGHGLGASLSPIYPHNLFLQVGIDGGIISIVILLIALAWPIFIGWRLFKFRNEIVISPLALGLFASYILLIFEYSKSGDFYKARDLFIIGSMFLGYASYLSRTHRIALVSIWRKMNIRAVKL